MYNTQDPFFVFKNGKKLQEKEEISMKKKVVSLLIAGLMMLEPCTMADAADLSDTEVIEQSVESAGDIARANVQITTYIIPIIGAVK